MALCRERFVPMLSVRFFVIKSYPALCFCLFLWLHPQKDKQNEEENTTELTKQFDRNVGRTKSLMTKIGSKFKKGGCHTVTSLTTLL